MPIFSRNIQGMDRPNTNSQIRCIETATGHSLEDVHKGRVPLNKTGFLKNLQKKIVHVCCANHLFIVVGNEAVIRLQKGKIYKR